MTWSDGEAGVTLVDFLASSVAESVDFYDFWFCTFLKTARLMKFTPIFERTLLRRIGSSELAHLQGLR